MGAQLVKEVATKTNDAAGDGTTTATLLAQAFVREGMKNVTAGANPMVVRKGIKKAVVRAIEERDGIKTLSENARKLAEDRFDLSSVAKDALEHYGNIADGFKDKRCLIVSV